MQKNKIIKIASITCAIGIITFGGYKLISHQKNDTQQVTTNNEIEYAVQKGQIYNSVSGSGSIKPSDKRILKSEINGRVENVLVKEGDVVQKDQMLISLKSDTSNDNNEVDSIKEKLDDNRSQLNELYNNQGKLNVYADISGVIKNLNIKSGDSLVENQSVGLIEETEYSYAQSYFYKDDVEKIKVGDKAYIFFSKFLTEYEGEIVSINHTPVQFGGGAFGYEVTAKVKNPGGFSEGDVTLISIKNNNEEINSANSGKILKNREENIQTNIAGKVKDINIKNGQYVNKGDLLFTIESDDINKKINKLEKEIKQYNEKLNKIYKGHNVYSPIEGTILNVEVSNDDVVDRSTTLITIANLDGMEVVLNIDELDILDLSIGQEAILQCDVFENEIFTGKISNISLEGNSQNGVTTYSVKVSIDDRKNLMSGMNVEVDIIVENKQDILTIPIESLNKTMDGYTVKVKDKDGNITETKIEIGSIDKYSVEVTSGLSEGDVIVFDINIQYTPQTDEITDAIIMPAVSFE